MNLVYSKYIIYKSNKNFTYLKKALVHIIIIKEKSRHSSSSFIFSS